MFRASKYSRFSGAASPSWRTIYRRGTESDRACPKTAVLHDHFNTSRISSCVASVFTSSSLIF
ncbi:hypothetical protein [Massilia eurypsychrophila]|jgi:hypothetical protein|uniref:hypothetical protein n=1 Tax=Massilia eurypsychrophila TaxID=1485217 RepID=UPI001034A578|nr:hypothetical protein [Massilia eurypsychrophila]